MVYIIGMGLDLPSVKSTLIYTNLEVQVSQIPAPLASWRPPISQPFLFLGIWSEAISTLLVLALV